MLIPAALGGMIHEGNADDVRARMIIEGANAPTTPAADEILDDKGVTVIPDVLANAGGVVVSYFEWVQNLQHFRWDEREVNDKLGTAMRRAYREVHGPRAGGGRRRCASPPTSSASSAWSRPRACAATSSEPATRGPRGGNRAARVERAAGRSRAVPGQREPSTPARPAALAGSDGVEIGRLSPQGRSASPPPSAIGGPDARPGTELGQDQSERPAATRRYLSQSKSRGGFCSNQSRSCSGVSWRNSGVSSSTSSPSAGGTAGSASAAGSSSSGSHGSSS